MLAFRWSVFQAALLYVGFLTVIAWRWCFPWQKGQTWRKSFNHFTILYGLLAVLFVCELVYFIITACKDFATASQYHATGNEKHEWPIGWLRMFVMCVPVFVLLTFITNVLQSRVHLNEICQDSAQLQHDRVVNILALPTVYGVMAMCGMARVYELVVAELVHKEAGLGGGVAQPHWRESVETSFAEYETCIYVGDLYEAWALYQFGKLTIDTLQKTFPPPPSDDEEEEPTSANPPSAGVSIKAMSNVMFVGTSLFIAACLIQSGYAIYMWFFRAPTEDWSTFSYYIEKFSYAGLVASFAAVYNVHMVEHTFGKFIKGYAPLLKFLSVKMVVVFAFWQNPTLLLLKTFGILGLTDAQMKLFQAALIAFECLIISVIHLFAWSSQEQWYFNPDDEETPLLDPDKTGKLSIERGEAVFSWPWSK